MGLFSGKVETYVSSSVYNLAGDPDDREDFVRSTVVRNIIADSDIGLGQALMKGLRDGTGHKQRRFFRWAKDNYELGMPTAKLNVAQKVDYDSVKAGMQSLLSLGSDDMLEIASAVIDDADPDYWAEDWVRENRPGITPDSWSAEYDADTDEIMIDIAGEAEPIRIAAPSDLLWGMNRSSSLRRKILYVSYRVVTLPEGGTATVGPQAMFTYRVGSGTLALDFLVDFREDLTEFFPVMPLRVNNKSIRDEGFEDELAAVKTAYRKMVGRNVDDLLDTLEDNENIGDIDYAFLIPGVTLNAKEPEARRYIYRFLQEMQNIQEGSVESFYLRQEEERQHEQELESYGNWLRAQYDAYQADYGVESPVASTETRPAFSPPAFNEIQVQCEGVPDFDFRIRWNAIKETQHLGNAKTFDGAARKKLKVGEFWFKPMPDFILRDPSPATAYNWTTGEVGNKFIDRPLSHVFLFHQHSKYRYSRLEIIGLEHRNYVYGANAVIISASEALKEDEESGFLFPLHYPTLKELGILRGTQLTTASNYLVLNSYKRVKQPWYASFGFKVIIFIAAVVLPVVAGPLVGAGTGIGIMGSNAAVGAALGVTGATAAAIVGAIVNGLAAVLITTVIQKASVAILGDKVGAIVGTVISFVAMTYGAAYANTGTFSVDWSAMMKIENIMKITNAVTDAYTRWMQADTMEIYESISRIEEHYSEKLEEVQAMADEILGVTGVSIDPIMFTDAAEYFGESRDGFLNRTLLTGSDLAELTHAMIESFSEISLELPQAIR